MVLYIPNEGHQNIIFFDTEFNDRKLIQVAMIIYEAININGIEAYVLKGSINVYITNEINYFFTRYTGITAGFLDSCSISELEATTLINEFLKDLNNSSTLLVAHGIKQDIDLLTTMGVKLDKVEQYCTYNHSKTLLNRDKNLKLIDVCNESGYFADEHDAYSDAKNVVHAYSYLKLVEAIAR
jgi:DNA polymerase III epsilon subunit-like protein